MYKKSRLLYMSILLSAPLMGLQLACGTVLIKAKWRVTNQ